MKTYEKENKHSEVVKGMRLRAVLKGVSATDTSEQNKDRIADIADQLNIKSFPSGSIRHRQTPSSPSSSGSPIASRKGKHAIEPDEYVLQARAYAIMGLILSTYASCPAGSRWIRP